MEVVSLRLYGEIEVMMREGLKSTKTPRRGAEELLAVNHSASTPISDHERVSTRIFLPFMVGASAYSGYMEALSLTLVTLN